MLEAVLPPDKSVRYEHRLVMGTAAEDIVKTADEEGVDMIVMGTHGRTGLMGVLMGSVAEAVMRHANCPVLTLASTKFRPEPLTPSHRCLLRSKGAVFFLKP